MKKKKRIKFFDVFLVILMLAISAVTLFPFLSVVATAFSSPKMVVLGKVGIFPREFQVATISYVLKLKEVVNAFKVTVFVTIVGTVVALVLEVLMAYPLSKPELKGRKFFLYLLAFVMLFVAGIVPNYLLYNAMHLLNTVWVLMIGGLLSVSNVFIIKNYFEGLPESIEEAAKIDGASSWRILTSVVLPMSKPVLATITLFTAVGFWNGYMAGVMYITNPKLKTLQHYLYSLLQSIALAAESNDIVAIEALSAISSANIRSAIIVVTTVPILVLYPFLQKHFVKGITIGSVK